MIPVVAILAAVFAGRDPETAGEIGIGAILGAPFMLATLAAMFVVGASALTFRNRRAKGSEIRCREVAADGFPWCKAPGKSVNIDADTIARDIAFFLLFVAVAAAVGVLELLYPLKVTLALLLIVAYALYVRRTLHSGAALRGCVGEAHAVAPELRAAVVDRRRPGVACARAHSGGGPDLRGRRRTHRRGRRAACGPRRARVGSSGHRAAGEDQIRHLGEGRQGHFGPRQHNGRDGLPEHRHRYLRRAVHTLGAGAAEPLLRRSSPHLRRVRLRRARAPQDDPVVAARGRRALLPRLSRRRRLRRALTTDL